ncbi:MAG: hypothetical protein M1472_03275 [Planctomycetes bacterium]|nr:hypothetical protein [Planctomycetota bacterium]
MPEIVLFAEDYAHEQIVGSMLRRLALTTGVTINLKCLNDTGGHGHVIQGLKLYIRDIKQFQSPRPELIVIAIDANCHGYNGRKKEIEGISGQLEVPVAYAIPNPHVERWLLIDPAAFKSVLGVGCAAPKQKCQRDLYKSLLRDAVERAGVTPSLGGIEYAADIVAKMDLLSTPQSDDSLEKFLAPVRQKFRQWAQEQAL